MNVLFPHRILAQSAFFETHQDWEVPIPGFLIVAPLRRGKKSLDAFSDEELKDFITFVARVRSTLREALGIEDVYIFQNEDSEHGFHLWMFPRYAWMEERFGKKIESVRPIMQYAKGDGATGEAIQQTRDAATTFAQWYREHYAH